MINAFIFDLFLSEQTPPSTLRFIVLQHAPKLCEKKLIVFDFWPNKFKRK